MSQQIYQASELFKSFPIISQREITTLKALGTGRSAKVNLQRHTCRIIQIDENGGLEMISGKKCDWCIQDCGKSGKYLFIELKGHGQKAAIKAIEQIGSTITWFRNHINGFSLSDVNKKCYAIMKAGCPKDTPSLKNAILKFKREFKCDFIRREEDYIIPLY